MIQAECSYQQPHEQMSPPAAGISAKSDEMSPVRGSGVRRRCIASKPRARQQSRQGLYSMPCFDMFSATVGGSCVVGRAVTRSIDLVAPSIARVNISTDVSFATNTTTFSTYFVGGVPWLLSFRSTSGPSNRHRLLMTIRCIRPC